jgi:hypothetical protein
MSEMLQRNVGITGALGDAPAGQQYRDQCKSILSIGTSYSNYITVFALCAQGRHERKREYGLCGIITAIVCPRFFV